MSLLFKGKTLTEELSFFNGDHSPESTELQALLINDSRKFLALSLIPCQKNPSDLDIVILEEIVFGFDIKPLQWITCFCENQINGIEILSTLGIEHSVI